MSGFKLIAIIRPLAKLYCQVSICGYEIEEFKRKLL